MASLSSVPICERLNGRPYPKGVESTRAHRPRRFGTMMSSRPFGAITRHSSRNSARVRSLHSSMCTRRSRSAHSSGSGSSVSSTSTLKPLPWSRPGDHAKLGRHQRAQGAGIGAEGAKIRRGEAETEQAHALQIAPARPEPCPKQAAHHAPERGGIEVLQIDGIEMHRRHHNCGSQARHPSPLWGGRQIFLIPPLMGRVDAEQRSAPGWSEALAPTPTPPKASSDLPARGRYEAQEVSQPPH